MPERIQLRRAAGWRMPTGAVKVDRGTAFGNPYRVEQHGREHALDEFSRLLARPDRRYERSDGQVREYPPDNLLWTALAGRDLACWCRLDVPCHADLLLAHLEALGEGYDEDPGEFA